ncbi:MAG: DUF3696 domain-containing protein [Bacteroidales bacterium]|nr:DUF3696 domain-containing protein [Bacteroidales bacterium]
MSWIKSITIENFRLFKKPATFDFAPLTLLTGPNNSGKSSLTKSLLILDDSSRKNAFNELEFNVRGIDLGDFKSVRNIDCKENDDIKFDITLENAREMYIPANKGHLLNPYETRIKLCYQESPGSARLRKIQIFDKAYNNKNGIEDLLFGYELIKERDELLALLYINYENLIGQIEQQVKEFKKSIKHHESKTSESIEEGRISVYIGPKSHELKAGQIFFDFKSVNPLLYRVNKKILDNSKLKPLLNQAGAHAADLFNLLNVFFIQELSYSVIDYNKNLKYIKETLGYLRADNNKWLMFLEYLNDHVFDSFRFSEFKGYLPDIKKKMLADKLQYVEYPELNNFQELLIKAYPTDYTKELINRNFKALIDHLFDVMNDVLVTSKIRRIKIDYAPADRFKRNKLHYYSDELSPITKNLHSAVRQQVAEENWKFVNHWIKKFKIGERLDISDSSGIGATISVITKNKSVDISTLGYGYAQLFFLMIKFLCRDIKKLNPYSNDFYTETVTLIIEEPESNLHPKLQSLLADFFIDAINKFNVRIILETHSEYLIRKLQYLTAMKTATCKDTKIYYFNEPDHSKRTGGEPLIRKIEILEDGSLTSDFGPGFFDEATNWKFELMRIKNAQKN